MKIYTKARRAISAILDVAIHGTDRPVRLADICARQGVSQSYLEHLFRMLVQEGILASVRGPGGGYRLNKPLAVVSVADVICAVDCVSPGPVSPRAAERHAGDGSVVTTELWSGLDDHLHEYLRTVSLAFVLAGAADAADWRQCEPVVARWPEAPHDSRARDRSPSPVWLLSAP